MRSPGEGLLGASVRTVLLSDRNLSGVSVRRLCGFEPFFDPRGDQYMYSRILNCDYEFVSPWWDEVSLNAKDLVSSRPVRRRQVITSSHISIHEFPSHVIRKYQ